MTKRVYGVHAEFYLKAANEEEARVIADRTLMLLEPLAEPRSPVTSVWEERLYGVETYFYVMAVDAHDAHGMMDQALKQLGAAEKPETHIGVWDHQKFSDRINAEG
jgi:hypothetical protein